MQSHVTGEHVAPGEWPLTHLTLVALDDTRIGSAVCAVASRAATAADVLVVVVVFAAFVSRC